MTQPAFSEADPGPDDSLAERPPWRDAEVAIHEAAHAVMDHYFGRAIIRATIDPEGDSDGQVLRAPYPRPDDDAMVISALAGSIALNVARNFRWVSGEHTAAAGSDWSTAMFLCSPKSRQAKPLSSPPDIALTQIQADILAAVMVHDQPPEEATVMRHDLYRLARVTERLLRRLWPRVLAIAAALLDHRTLTGEDIDGLIGSQGGSISREMTPTLNP